MQVLQGKVITKLQVWKLIFKHLHWPSLGYNRIKKISSIIFAFAEVMQKNPRAFFYWTQCINKQPIHCDSIEMASYLKMV